MIYVLDKRFHTNSVGILIKKKKILLKLVLLQKKYGYIIIRIYGVAPVTKFQIALRKVKTGKPLD